MSGQKHIYGLKFLAVGLVSLIANGEVESIETIEQKLEDGTIINYLDSKYASDGAGFFGKGNRPEHHIPELEKTLQNVPNDLAYLAPNKYAIKDDKMSGLSMLLNLVIEEMKE